MTTEESKETKRELILRAAERLFIGRRFDEVKLEEIAAAAGVGKGTLYLYFKNKEDLFVALAGEGTTEIAARIRELADEPGPFRDRLRRFGEELSEFACQRHGWMRMVQQISSRSLEEKMRPHHEPVKNAVVYFLNKGVEEGVLREDLSIKTLECMLVGSIFARARQSQQCGNDVDLIQLIQGFWDGAKKVEL
jgi:AcrR family transcriptional regulator